MEINPKYGVLPDDETVDRTSEALRKNGINVIIAENVHDAKKIILGLIPKGAEVMNMTSVTLDALNVSGEIEAGEYDSVRAKLGSMEQAEKQRLGAAPEWVVGSVHAVTEDGKVMVASATGSQLPAYAYGSSHVIWVVGAQKIVKNVEEGMKRLYEYSLPLENERALKVYGVGSGVNKILIVNKEVAADRITMVLIKEKLGF